MYITNIDTNHALSTIASFLCTSPPFLSRIGSLAAEPLIEALDIIMCNSSFKFGDIAWEQLEGTSSIMGAPPPSVPTMYATLYFGITKLQNIPHLFSEKSAFCFTVAIHTYLPLHDCFGGAWLLLPANPNIDSHDEEWTAFQNSMSYGKLNWIFTMT
jgi:hypothetical protein